MGAAVETVVDRFDQRAAEFGRRVRACAYRSQRSFLQRQEIVLRLLGHPKGKRILDVGCGPALLSEPLARDNCLVGVDVSERMLSLAQASLRPVRTDGRSLPFAAGSFDAVLAIEVVQLLKSLGDVRNFLGQLSGVTKKGGRLIVSSLNHSSALHRILSAFGGYAGLHFHDLRGIQAVLAEEKFETLDTRFLGYPLPLEWSGSAQARPSPWATSWMIFCEKR